LANCPNVKTALATSQDAGTLPLWKKQNVWKVAGKNCEAAGMNSRPIRAIWITASETPKKARRFEVLHRRNCFEEVPEAPDLRKQHAL
jgi:hypothetical protein